MIVVIEWPDGDTRTVHGVPHDGNPVATCRAYVAGCTLPGLPVARCTAFDDDDDEPIATIDRVGDTLIEWPTR